MTGRDLFPFGDFIRAFDFGAVFRKTVCLQSGQILIPLLGLMVLALGGCFGPKEPPHYLDEGERHLIRLERAGGGGGYHHPVDLEVALLRAALGSVVTRHEVSFLNRLLTEQKATVAPAFTPDETALLADRLKIALARATAEEWVAFFFTGRKNALTTEVTSGVTFVKGNELYLVFANVRAPVSTERHPYISRDQALYTYDSGRFDLVIRPHQRKISDGVGRGKPAIAVDLADLAALKEGPTLPEGGGLVQESEGTASEEGKIEAKLRWLRRLKDEGLITEEDYKEKKLQLLQSIKIE
ncbi:MAG: hypothetical protein WAO55_05705 [Candidatus Manganitrophaceae bacterium]